MQEDFRKRGNQEYFRTGIHALIKKLKEEKDTKMKVTTLCFQMHFITTFSSEALEVNTRGEFITNLKFLVPTKVDAFFETINFTKFTLEFIERSENRPNKSEQTKKIINSVSKIVS